MNQTSRTGNKRLTAIMMTAAALLLVPFVAMQLGTGVDWSLLDFAIAAFLLFGTGLLCELVLRKVHTMRNRILLCGAILMLLFLTWAELAVGVFGTPFAGS